MKKYLFILILLFLVPMFFSFFYMKEREMASYSDLAVYLDGVSTSFIPAQSDGYFFESVQCNNGVQGFWNNETWSLKLSGLTKTRSKCPLNFKKIKIGDTWDFTSKRELQTFLVNHTGKYRIELWGGSGR